MSAAANLIVAEEDVDIDRGLLAYYRFDGNTKDATELFDGSIHGGVTFASGLFNKSASFNGSSSYVKVDSNRLKSNVFSVELHCG